MAKSELGWTNITRGDLASAQAQVAWDMFLEAKRELERYLAAQAVELGAAQEGDSFKFAYRHIGQGSVGMAIDTPAKAQASGFGGLRKPVDKQAQEALNLAAYLAERKASGRRF